MARPKPTSIDDCYKLFHFHELMYVEKIIILEEKVAKMESEFSTLKEALMTTETELKKYQEGKAVKRKP